MIWFATTPLAADTLRIATYHTELSARGPGLMLRDILKETDHVASVANVVATVRPDILLLLDVDWDRGGAGLAALAMLLDYPHAFAAQPNTGIMTAQDRDGDGRLGGPGDAQGFGYFLGQGGMAMLSRFPIEADRVVDHSALLWRDLPGARLPQTTAGAFYAPDILADQRLADVALWEVPVIAGGQRIDLWALHANTPVFDGPEDRNGLRNRDTLRFWQQRLETAAHPFVLLGNTNLDPLDGDGHAATMRALLADPRLQDPQPSSAGAVAASALQGGINADHQGDPARDTADWRDTPGPGNLRVDYVLPSATLTVTDAGVFWPAPDDPAHAILGAPDAASRHRLVWVDIAWPPG